ncbi:helicase-associated domain-containing protein [Salinibacterium sp. SYSU T00001]|uniref:helicase-associated domain-containing protein n=1 Tax=Homoserinimonas sedimenticola TaxID=2986805 RepID=UPI0022369B4A|nr:helicase-associated domain-containing protein [Salinibacterium sedimenticola]MCW4386156.1 helicase-associated domain-containing protein [Salinibacterium sedimenticola]
MGNTLTLAATLRAMPHDELLAGLRARDLGLSPAATASIRDHFDLADALLAHDAVQQALTRLDRHTLTALALLAREQRPMTPTEIADALAPLSSRPPHAGAVGDNLDAAAGLLLARRVGDAFECFDAVCDQLRSWPVFGLPSLEQLAGDDAGAALERVPDVERRFIDKLAAERAFTATSAMTELLLELERQPARELAKGGVALPDAKRLAATMLVDLDTVSAYLSLAERGELVCREGGSWMTTEQGNRWLGQPTSTRWRALTAAWFSRLPDDIRNLLGERSHAIWGDGLRSYIDWLYPVGGEWMDERVTAYTRDAELLGITAAQAPSGPGALLLAGRADEAEDVIRPLLPHEVDTVYLQHDLSVVAPGPLQPAIDERMRVVADVEGRGLATTYRISAASVNRALTAGETAESLREFLSGISSTGIPQPLDYLITEGAARYGLLRVGELDGDTLDPDDPAHGARSYLRSDDADLLGTVAVDQSLASLGLARISEHRLVSRFDRDLVFWSLSDARYPVAAEDDGGQVLALRRHRIARTGRHSFADPLAELVTRLADEAGDDDADATNTAWLGKQIESAARAKTALVVSIRMPGGDVVDYELEPTSVSGGRMRARDRRSEIERTLPLSSVTAVRAAD